MRDQAVVRTAGGARYGTRTSAHREGDRAARTFGYAEALVTTLPDTMPIAAAMYARLGFTETEPFFDHSHVERQVPMVYLHLVLGRADARQ